MEEGREDRIKKGKRSADRRGGRDGRE